MLSDPAQSALALCFATRGKHKGQLLARCPASHTLAAAAWQGAMLVVNPYKAGIATMLFMTAEQRAIMNEVTAHFEALPKDHMIIADRDREGLEGLGVW